MARISDKIFYHEKGVDFVCDESMGVQCSKLDALRLLARANEVRP